MSDTDPRCPWHDMLLYFPSLGVAGSVATCPHPHCTFRLVAETREELCAKANDMKLLDRKVREAVDAELSSVVTWLSGIQECGECDLLERVSKGIIARKDASRRQAVDNLKGT